MHAGHFAQIHCIVAEGDLPLTIQWTFNGESLKKYPEVLVANMGKRSSILTIESVSYINSGNYSCEVRNNAGSFVHVAQLLVNG